MFNFVPFRKSPRLYIPAIVFLAALVVILGTAYLSALVNDDPVLQARVISAAVACVVGFALAAVILVVVPGVIQSRLERAIAKALARYPGASSVLVDAASDSQGDSWWGLVRGEIPAAPDILLLDPEQRDLLLLSMSGARVASWPRSEFRDDLPASISTDAAGNSSVVVIRRSASDAPLVFGINGSLRTLDPVREFVAAFNGR